MEEIRIMNNTQIIVNYLNQAQIIKCGKKTSKKNLSSKIITSIINQDPGGKKSISLLRE